MPDVSPSAPSIGIDAYALLLQAHTTSIQNSTQISQHVNECNDRDRRNERMFKDTKDTIIKLFERLETNKISLSESISKVSDDVNRSNKWIYMIVGGITLAGYLLEHAPKLFGG